MSTLWPWLAIAGLGALHGLHPANGWMFAAARATRADRAGEAWRALVPIAFGHAAAILLIAVAFARGLKVAPDPTARIAGLVLLGLACHRLLRGERTHDSATTERMGAAGLALWSALMATAHGLGMVLVPALVPLCLSAGPWREFAGSGASSLLLAAVAVHMAAMLVVTGVLAHTAWRGLRTGARRWRGATGRHLWTLALGFIGALLLVSP
ncbi:hypothetical protein [Pseudoxanthomonas beigongshangi]